MALCSIEPGIVPILRLLNLLADDFELMTVLGICHRVLARPESLRPLYMMDRLFGYRIVGSPLKFAG